MGYSRDDSEFYARKETDDLSETPDNNADKEIPTKKSQKKKTLPSQSQKRLMNSAESPCNQCYRAWFRV